MSRRPSGKARRSQSRRQKARHQLGRIAEHLTKGNIILEVRDARAPRTTDPARLVKMPEGRVRCLVLTKTDLAEPETTRAWEEHFRSQGFLVLSVDQKKAREAGKKVRGLLKQAAKRAKSALGQGRAVVVGLPNVGKSTLINRVLGRNALRAGDRPGVTKGESWCKIDESLFLLDTPGVIEAMNRLVQEDDESDVKLGLMRVAPAALLDPVQAARSVLDTYADRLAPPGGMPDEAGAQERLEALARRWNKLSTGGQPDVAAAASRIMKDVAAGEWGRLSLEHPEES